MESRSKTPPESSPSTIFDNSPVDVCPLSAMIMDIVADLTEEDAPRLEDPVGFRREGRTEMGEAVPGLRPGLQHEPKACVEVLLLVPALVRHVRGVVDDHIHALGRERHAGV